MEQQLNLENGSKVVRISDANYKKIVSQGKFGETFDNVLSKVLGQNEKWVT